MRLTAFPQFSRNSGIQSHRGNAARLRKSTDELPASKSLAGEFRAALSSSSEQGFPSSSPRSRVEARAFHARSFPWSSRREVMVNRKPGKISGHVQEIRSKRGPLSSCSRRGSPRKRERLEDHRETRGTRWPGGAFAGTKDRGKSVRRNARAADRWPIRTNRFDRRPCSRFQRENVRRSRGTL